MIIQCEKCQTRFRLDDSRVTDKGVKVRCTKCKHVFRVRKQAAESEPSVSVEALAAFTHVAMPGEDATDSGLRETSPPDDSAISFESDNLDGNVSESAESVANVSEVDFSAFDFGDAGSEPDSAPFSTVSIDDFTDGEIESVPVSTRKEALQGLDFSDDDMFGAVVPSAPEESGAAISFDFEGDDSFAESMDMGGHDSSGKSGTLFSLDTGDAPFSLGEIDFGDELTSVAVQQVNPEDLKPSQEILFAPLVEAPTESLGDDFLPPLSELVSVEEQQELPPLSIVSRRKQSPLFGVVIAVVALVVILVLGYLGYSSFYPVKSVTTESGRISVRAVKSAFIDNSNVGQLLVVSGEAFNEFSTPRAALQVKVTVLDSAGHNVATKSAYGGNPLTEEQLESLPLDKIDAAMANQFGDSLANMEVAPGSMIPFVVVLANLPDGAKDFTVQSSGSTVATGKQ